MSLYTQEFYNELMQHLNTKIYVSLQAQNVTYPQHLKTTFVLLKMKTMNSKIIYHRSGMTFKIKGDWPEQSKLLQETYPQLTDKDLQFTFGKEHDLLKKVESRLRLSREEVMKILEKSFPRKALQIRFKTRRNLTHRN